MPFKKLLHPFESKLQTRLVGLTLLISITLMILVVAFVIGRAGSQMAEDADTQLELTNHVLKTKATTWLDLNVKALEALVTMPAIQSMDADQQKPILETLHNAYPYMYLVSTTDLAGLNVARNDTEQPKDYSNRVWFQMARDGAPLTFQSLIGQTSGEPALVVSMPIKVNDEIVGVGMFAADLDDITTQVSASTIGDTGFAYIVDEQNRAIAHPNSRYTSELRDLSAESPIAALRDGKIGNTEFEDADGRHWRAYVDELDNGWGIVIQQRSDEILHAQHVFQQIAWAALGLGALGLFIFSWVLIGRALKPIGVLTETADAIAGGDFKRAAPEYHKDEIGRLARAFNSMTKQLRELIDNLEERVNARTRDLQMAADVSKQVTTILNLNQLLEQVVTSTVSGFGLNAALVFLLDPDGQKLVRTAGANTQGQLLDDNVVSEIPLDAEPSIIALAGRTRQPIKLDDVTTSPAYMPLPALPDTRSELAIPMLLGDKLLGVFDLQAATVGRFTDDDRRVLTSLAEQITTAVRNAQLFDQAETALQEAERANRVKSQFLASMSHELRTPLNAILNFTQFVSSGMLGPVTERQVNALNKSVSSGEHLLNLINDVLDISKIEAGALQLFIEEQLDLHEDIQMVAASGKSLLEDKPVEFILDIEEPLPLVSGDRQRIRQILLNLVSNACKFTDTGSVKLSVVPQNGNVLFSVKDTGAGIAPEDHELIFTTFQQTQVGLKKGGGTGLGLPISRRLAEAHGGALWLESTVGEGSIFYVTLPILAKQGEKHD